MRRHDEHRRDLKDIYANVDITQGQLEAVFDALRAIRKRMADVISAIRQYVEVRVGYPSVRLTLALPCRDCASLPLDSDP